MSERYTHLDSIKVDGIASTSQQGALIGASKVMPQPSADLDGVTIQYMGPTDSTYTFKRMYTCAMVGSEYKWIDATPVDVVQNSDGVFIGGTEIGVADSTKYGVMSPEQSEKVATSFEKLETVKEGAEPNKVDIIRVEGTPLQVSGVDKSVNITRDSLGLGDSAQLDVGTLEGQIPVLGANGQLPKSTIPPYATGTYVGSVRTKALLTSLTTAEIGDWAKVTSDDDFNNNGAYILNGTAPGVLTNWVQMVGPANVESVNGKSGRVVLDKEDIGLANVDNTSDAKKPISEATQSALNDCVKLSGSDSAQVITNGGLQLPNGDLSVGGGALVGKDTEPALLRVRGSIEATQSISGQLVQTENVASNDSSTKVASTAWVNSADSVLHTTGGTMTGTLQINNGILQFKKQSLESNDKATAQKEVSRVRFVANDTSEVSSFISIASNTENRSLVRATRRINGVDVSSDLVVGILNTKEQYVSGPTPVSASDNTGKFATTKWVNSASTVVHTTGNETITGEKIFRGSNVFLSKSWTPSICAISDEPSDATASYKSYFRLVAKGDGAVDSTSAGRVGNIEVDRFTNKASVGISAYNKDGVESNISIISTDEGSKYATAPSWSVGTADNTDKILTTKMANSLPSLVHTTGNEEISGTKTFSNLVHIKSSNPYYVTDSTVMDFTSTTAPQAIQRQGIYHRDLNGLNLCALEYTINTSGNRSYTLAYRKGHDSSASNWAYLGINETASGTIYGSAPATDDAQPDNAIVTKKYLLDKIAALEARISALEGSQ